MARPVPASCGIGPSTAIDGSVSAHCRPDPSPSDHPLGSVGVPRAAERLRWRAAVLVLGGMANPSGSPSRHRGQDVSVPEDVDQQPMQPKGAFR